MPKPCVFWNMSNSETVLSSSAYMRYFLRTKPYKPPTCLMDVRRSINALWLQLCLFLIMAIFIRVSLVLIHSSVDFIKSTCWVNKPYYLTFHRTLSGMDHRGIYILSLSSHADFQRRWSKKYNKSWKTHYSTLIMIQCILSI